MIEHVEQDNLSLSDAHSLLEAAGGQGGAVALEHLKQDLETIFTEIRGQIKVKQQEKAEQGKELKGTATKVKTYYQKHQMQSWILALKQGKRLARPSPVQVRGEHRPRETGQATLRPVTLSTSGRRRIGSVGGNHCQTRQGREAT